MLVWNTRTGPVGAVNGYLWSKGKVWLTAAAERANRLAALERDPRVTVVVSSRGLDLPPHFSPRQLVSSSVSIRGRCEILKDDATRRWFLKETQKKRFPDNEAQQQAMVEMLDEPTRYILCVTPEKFTSLHSAEYMDDVYRPALDSVG